MVSTLWNKKYYTTPFKYVTSSFIREYDISKADINVFFSKGIINIDQYRYLSRIPSEARNIQMGLLQRENKEYIKILKDGITEARRLFFEANDIQDWEVLSIKNDAIFLIEKLAKRTSFGNILFRNKNTYTSFYALPRRLNKEFYYYLNTAIGEESLTVKGIGDEAFSLHNGYMNEFLMVLFDSIERYPIDDAIDLIQKFYNNYITGQLELGYYRRYDQRSGYDMNIRTPVLQSGYNVAHITDEYRDMIDISYNAAMIREFYKIVSNMYFTQKK